MFEQIIILPTRVRVAAEIRKAILTGKLRAGDEIVQDKIAGMLGVSRMPVREAIQLLATEGLIKIHPNKSAVVNEIPNDFIKDHYEVRILLECKAVELACSRIKNIDDIYRIHEEYLKAISDGNIEQVQLLNQSFHIMIWDMAGNAKLKSFLQQLWNGMAVLIDAGSLVYSVKEHEKIIKALRERNPDKAKQAMKKHMESSMNNILNSKKNAAELIR